MDLRPGHRPQWTHRLLLGGSPTDHLSELLRLLQSVLVLCVGDDVDGAIALDFYKQPCPTDPSQLENSPVGNLVHKIKYESPDLTGAGMAGSELCGALCATVTKHPWYRSASRILPVPGHAETLVPSTSVRIGLTVARTLGIQVTPVLSHTAIRPPAKNMTPEERASFAGDFFVTEDLNGRTILVVDDVYHTGLTTADVARAARLAGATTVLGLVAVRNLRR